MNEKEQKTIEAIIKRENNLLYKRFQGHLHKQEDQIIRLLKDVDDLKAFVKLSLMERKERVES